MPLARFRREMTILVAIAAAAAILRLGLGLSFRQNYYAVPLAGTQLRSEADYLRTGLMELTDSQQYLLLARSLPAYHWDGRPNTFRPPGYPMFIRLCGSRVPVLLFVQALLGGLSVLGIGWLALRRFGKAAGYAAALLLAIDVPSLLYSGLVMSETLFAALVVLALVLHERGHVALTGLALGFGALVRPVGLVLVLPFAIALALRHDWRRTVLLVALFAVLPALWCGRNWFYYHRVAYTSNGAFNLLYSDAAAVVASREHVPRDSARTLVAQQAAVPEDEENPLAIAPLLEREALRVIAGDPLRYAGLAARGIGWTLTGTKSDELVGFLIRGAETGYGASVGTRLRSADGTERAVVLGLSAIELLLTAGSLLLALIALLRRRTSAKVLLPLAVAVCLVLAVGPFTDGRFRVPVMPLIYLSAVAVLSVGRAASARRLLDGAAP
jgi:4-amino-4-deoxy-L-arabinose transferase-like glycosyltransferase